MKAGRPSLSDSLDAYHDRSWIGVGRLRGWRDEREGQRRSLRSIIQREMLLVAFAAVGDDSYLRDAPA